MNGFNDGIPESAGNSSCCYNASFVSPLWSVAASSVHSWDAGRGEAGRWPPLRGGRSFG